MTSAASNASLLVLNPRLPAHQADALRLQFESAAGEDLEVDAGGVESVSTLCIQVMLAAAKSWKASGSSLRLINVSDEFAAAIARLAIDIDHFEAVGARS